jgi:arylformamidase
VTLLVAPPRVVCDVMLRARLKLGAAIGAGVAIAVCMAAQAPADAGAASFAVERDVSYDLGSPPPATQPDANLLDVYRPRGMRDRLRPVVVWIHGGGWRKGDKRVGVRKKAQLFTDERYVFASVNYRLSHGPFDPRRPDPGRTLFPDHPRDVAEALAWLDANVREYGGDRRRVIVIGHSAGAHLAALVATDASYLREHGVRRRRPVGFVALDSPVYDVAKGADPRTSQRPRDGMEMLWNAFGTPEENDASDAWRLGSPVEFAGPEDPPALLVTQRHAQLHREHARGMARALGRRPGRAVLTLDLDHREINRVLGDPADPSGETQAVVRFVRRATRPRR